MSQHLWQVALSRVVVGIGTAGIELLVVVIINGMPAENSPFSFALTAKIIFSFMNCHFGQALPYLLAPLVLCLEDQLVLLLRTA